MGSEEILGYCRLCLQEGVLLCNSHFLPAALYRILRGNPEVAKPEPYMISEQGAVQTSKQLRAHLLCGKCEALFDKLGEKWIFRFGPKANGCFPLKSILHSEIPAASDSQTKLYFASTIPKVNVCAITYFAASMFWRAAVHPWNTDHTYPVGLGLYKERFRRYLLELEEFPKDAFLSVLVRNGLDSTRVTHEPMTRKDHKVYFHQFAMPGFIFILFVGKHVPDKFRGSCFVHADGNPIMLSSVLETSVAKQLVRKHELTRKQI